MRILSIDGKPVESGNDYKKYLRIEEYDNSGLDIQFEFSKGTTNQPKKYICIFVKNIHSTQGQIFRNPIPTSDVWRITRVGLNDLKSQGKYYTIQLGLLKKDLKDSIISVEQWNKSISGASERVYLQVQKIIPGDKNEKRGPQISITKIGEEQVDLNEGKILISPEVSSVEGSFSLPLTKKNVFIYVIIHEKGIEKNRLVGPVKIEGNTWQLSNIYIPQIYKPLSRNYSLSAILADSPITQKNLTDEELISRSLAIAPAFQIGVENGVINRSGLTINQFLLEGDTLSLLKGEKMIEIDSLELVHEIRGTYKHRAFPPQSEIWVWANPLGKSYWILLGRTNITNQSEWDLQVNIPLPLKAFRDSVTRIVAISSPHYFDRKVISYDHWFTRSFARSQSVLLVEETPGNHLVKANLNEMNIHGFGKDGPKDQLTFDDIIHTTIEGYAKNLPEKSNIWGGIRLNPQSPWAIYGPAFREKKHWELTGIDSLFSEGKSLHTGQIIFFSSLVDSIPQQLSSGELDYHAIKKSPVYEINTHKSQLPVSFSSINNSVSMIWTILFFILLLALLTVFEYYFGIIAYFSTLMSYELYGLSESFQKKMEGVKKPNMAETVLGFMILGLTIFAISNYFPVYSHAIQSVFNLKEDKGNSLAILFIVFVGLTGILIHLNAEYGFSESETPPEAAKDPQKTDAKPLEKIDLSEGNTSNEEENNTQDISTYITLILILLALVQSLVYFQLYTSASADNVLPAIAMAIAAFFITIIEALSIYFSTRFLIEFLSWFFYNTIDIFIKISAGIFAIIRNIFGFNAERKEKLTQFSNWLSKTLSGKFPKKDSTQPNPADNSGNK